MTTACSSPIRPDAPVTLPAPVRARVKALLDTAATTPFDSPVWEQLRGTARALVAELITQRVLPDHLAVAADEPPVVVVRTLVAAWRRVTWTPLRDGDPAGGDGLGGRSVRL